MPRHILIADGPALPEPTEIDRFWQRAREQFSGLGDDYQVRSLGIDEDTTTQILDYIKTRNSSSSTSRWKKTRQHTHSCCFSCSIWP